MALRMKHGVCLIGTNSENGRLGRLGRLAEPSAPNGRRFGKLWRDSPFHLQNSETKPICLRCYGVAKH